VAKNPDPASKLPYLIALPLGPSPLVLKAADKWPRTSKVYCHRADAWPEDPEVLEEIPVRSCVKRGQAIDLVCGFRVISYTRSDRKGSRDNYADTRCGQSSP